MTELFFGHFKNIFVYDQKTACTANLIFF